VKGALQKFKHAPGKGICICGRNKPAILAVTQRLRDAADSSGDNRPGQAPSLKQRNRKPFTQGGKHNDIEICDKILHVWSLSEQVYARANAESIRLVP
jgi:hypothetical protein